MSAEDMDSSGSAKVGGGSPPADSGLHQAETTIESVEELAIGRVITYRGKPPSAELLKNYFDREPTNAITAESVREGRRSDDAGCYLGQDGHVGDANMGEFCNCINARLTWVLRGLLIHPGVSSSARAVIEAALA